MTYQDILRFSAITIRNVFADADMPIIGIYLFGSRSRGDYQPESDWDFLVCCKNDLPFSQKATLSGKIQTLLAEKMISADIIIKSKRNVLEEQKNVGIITFYAIKDGIPV